MLCVPICLHALIMGLCRICTSLNVLDNQDSCLLTFPYSEPSAQSPPYLALEIQLKDHLLREAPP